MRRNNMAVAPAGTPVRAVPGYRCGSEEPVRTDSRNRAGHADDGIVTLFEFFLAFFPMENRVKDGWLRRLSQNGHIESWTKLNTCTIDSRFRSSLHIREHKNVRCCHQVEQRIEHYRRKSSDRSLQTGNWVASGQLFAHQSDYDC